MINRNEWRTGGARIGKVYRVLPSDLGRVGNCWMRGRLREGDLVTPISHSGDCFWQWQLINGEGPFTYHARGAVGPGFKINAGVRFGGYCMGELLAHQPTDREYHLLMAGETVHFTGGTEP